MTAHRRRRVWPIAALVLALVTSACSDRDQRAGGSPAETGVTVVNADVLDTLVQSPLSDVPAFALTEPRPADETDELLRRAAQNTKFCDLLTFLDRLEEPPHDDVDALIRYARDYYNLVFTLDPTSKVNDVSGGSTRKAPLPREILDAAETQRREMYAYWVRLQYTHALDAGGHLDDVSAEDADATSALEARLEDAFVALVNSDYTPAERTVERYRVGACSTVGVA